MSKLTFKKKVLVALSAVALLGASAGTQAWGGPDYRDGYRQDRYELRHDVRARDYNESMARRAAYDGDWRAAHHYHRIADERNDEAQSDRHQMWRDRHGW